MRKRIYIAGCGRSGTTLLWKLMRSFNNTCCHPGEASVSIFDGLADYSEQVIVAKRKAVSRFELPDLDPGIELIYCVRHPFDVMTSCLSGPKTKENNKNKYYISMLRWLSEYNALNRLRLRQLDRKVQYVRYEDVVTKPDSVQARLADAFHLDIEEKFSEYRYPPDLLDSSGNWDSNPRLNASEEIRRRISESDGHLIQKASMRKWERESGKRDYMYSFPMEVRSEFLPFCTEFGYDLPGDYLNNG